MPNYDDIFNVRGDLYNQATALCPDARQTERRLLIDRLAPRSGDVIGDAPAGGGYLADGLARLGVEVVCIEPAPRFAEAIAGRHQTVICPLDAIELPDRSVDHLGSLAGLHHLDDPQRFFEEAFRVIRPGGRLAVGDVKRGTPVATFLNDAVDRLTETGHDGRFFDAGDFVRMLAGAGFVDIQERHERYTWPFPDRPTLVAYCRSLFGMVKATPNQTAEEIEAVLDVHEVDGQTHLGWSLLYAVGTKPA